MAHLRVTPSTFFFCLFDFSSFFFCLFSVQHNSLLASVSEFPNRCFLRGRCAMETWCPYDTVRDSCGWSGRPTGREHDSNSRSGVEGSRGAGASSRKKTERPQFGLLLLLWVPSVHLHNRRVHASHVD